MEFQKIAHLLAEILGEDDEDITEQTEFTEEFRIKPVDVAKLVIAVEKEFDIIIYDDEAAIFKNVGNVVRHVKNVLDSY